VSDRPIGPPFASLENDTILYRIDSSQHAGGRLWLDDLEETLVMLVSDNGGWATQSVTSSASVIRRRAFLLASGRRSSLCNR
jgi:hypothetical protein